MPAKKRKKDLTSDLLKEHFVHYVSKFHQFPEEVVSLGEEFNFDETAFYQFYDSLDDLHADVWKSFVIETVIVLSDDPQFPTFTVREQLLAFYYTHLEVLKPRRDFIKICDELSRPLPLPHYLKAYKDEFISFGNSLIEAGIQSGEIADRKFINKSYSNGLWAQLIFVVKFWIKDESPEFEKTDAAIEKAVNLSAELVRPGPMDSIIDFAKFIYQNRK